MANAVTRLITWLNGAFVGEDRYGNRYYQEKRPATPGKPRRWVTYRSGTDDEPTQTPPQHHAWLHYVTDVYPDDTAPQPAWVRPRRINPTGTPSAQRPAGHPAAGGVRPAATGDYEPWRP